MLLPSADGSLLLSIRPFSVCDIFPVSSGFHSTYHLTEFADVLEQLESQFYAAGLQQFQSSDYSAAGFTSSQLAIQQITNIQSNEATHDTALQVCVVFR